MPNDKGSSGGSSHSHIPGKDHPSKGGTNLPNAPPTKASPTKSGTSSAARETGSVISFYVKIEHLIASNHGSARNSHGDWIPPDNSDSLRRENGMVLYLRGGRMNSPVGTYALGGQYGVASVFSQRPNLLAVNCDAITASLVDNGGWRRLAFNHQRDGVTQRYYSYVDPAGDRGSMAARGSNRWVPQLIPAHHNPPTQFNSTGNAIPATRTQAGLIGKLPLLIALAAFSCPPANVADVLRDSIRAKVWRHHNLGDGRDNDGRGMIVTIYYDPNNPQGSSKLVLDGLQDGRYGPFYGP